MGLDIVELVIRTEEVFGITIENYDAEKIRTVGDLYELVCKLLNVSPTPDPDKLTGVHHPPSKYGPLSQHTPENIWIKLVVTIHDQLQVDVSEIRYNATFQNDLGAD
jgi:acyl carrier protein